MNMEQLTFFSNYLYPVPSYVWLDISRIMKHNLQASISFTEELPLGKQCHQINISLNSVLQYNIRGFYFTGLCSSVSTLAATVGILLFSES
jgi:hypothetical protein